MAIVVSPEPGLDNEFKLTTGTAYVLVSGSIHSVVKGVGVACTYKIVAGEKCDKAALLTILLSDGLASSHGTLPSFDEL